MGCVVFVIQYHDTNIKFYARTNLSETLQRDVFLSIIKFDSIETSHILLVILYHEDLYSLLSNMTMKKNITTAIDQLIDT